MSHPLPPKKEVALALLERSSVHVHLDPRGAGVVVPPWFKRQPQLVLQIGLNLPVPIEDLRLDDEGMCCTLSFNRSPFYCVVPWVSVFAMVGDDGRGMVWPDEVPPEIAKQRPQETEKEPRRARGLPPQAGTPGGPRRGPVEEAREEKPASKGKKGKKRRPPPDADEGRPQLVAVPPQEPEPTRLRPDRAPRPVPSPRPAAVPRKSPSKPKRELPPYLRVVK
jgi:stringent starvation protein B